MFAMMTGRIDLAVELRCILEVVSTMFVDLITGELEALCVEIILKSHKLLLFGVYRPPNTGSA